MITIDENDLIKNYKRCLMKHTETIKLFKNLLDFLYTTWITNHIMFRKLEYFKQFIIHNNSNHFSLSFSILEKPTYNTNLLPSYYLLLWKFLTSCESISEIICIDIIDVLMKKNNLQVFKNFNSYTHIIGYATKNSIIFM